MSRADYDSPAMTTNLDAMSSAQRRGAWKRVLGSVVLAPVIAVGTVVGFLLMVVAGGFLIYMVTTALTAFLTAVFSTATN